MEPHQQIKNGNVFRVIKDYWFLFVLLVTIAVGWSEMRAQIKANQLVNLDQEAQIKANIERLNETNVKSAVSEERFKNLEQKVDNILRAVTGEISVR